VTRRNADQVHRSAKLSLAFLTVLAVGLFAIAGAILYSEARTPEQWDPLGDYEVQVVTSRVDGVPGPAVHLGGLVEVIGVKCNDEPTPVQVEGVVSWQAMDPPGAAIETGAGTADRPPGCTSQRYANPIPVEVRVAIRAQHAQGVDRPVWRIRGVETPVRGHEEGATARWVTENFTVIE